MIGWYWIAVSFWAGTVATAIVAPWSLQIARRRGFRLGWRRGQLELFAADRTPVPTVEEIDSMLSEDADEFTAGWLP